MGVEYTPIMTDEELDERLDAFPAKKIGELAIDINEFEDL